MTQPYGSRRYPLVDPLATGGYTAGLPLRRGGRVVECTGLLSRRALHGYPGFESRPLRQTSLVGPVSQRIGLPPTLPRTPVPVGYAILPTDVWGGLKGAGEVCESTRHVQQNDRPSEVLHWQPQECTIRIGNAKVGE